MTLKSIACAVLALTLSLGNLSLAQGRGERGERERNDRESSERNRDRGRAEQSPRDPLAQRRANAPRPADNAPPPADNGRADDRRGDNRQWNHRRGDDHRPDARYERYERYDRGDRYGGNDRYRGPRGAGPSQRYYRGDRLPYEYRSPQWVVNDWYGHGLHSPPHGYRWVQYGSDYLLVAIATGVILQLLLND